MGRVIGLSWLQLAHSKTLLDNPNYDTARWAEKRIQTAQEVST
jgi:hypothetical protein